MSERENNVYLAKLSEQAERYDEMSDYMKAVAEISQELSVEVGQAFTRRPHFRSAISCLLLTKMRLVLVVPPGGSFPRSSRRRRPRGTLRTLS